MDKKKSQHYNFCYDVIPAIFHSQTSDFVKYAEQDGLQFIEFWWNHIGQQLPYEMLVKFTNAHLEIVEPKAGTKVIFLQLPPPQEAGEMYYLAMIAHPERRFAWVRLPTTRILGLVKQSKEKFPEGTELGDLTPRRIFVSLGQGLSPSFTLFKQKVLELAKITNK